MIYHRRLASLACKSYLSQKSRVVFPVFTRLDVKLEKNFFAIHCFDLSACQCANAFDHLAVATDDDGFLCIPLDKNRGFDIDHAILPFRVFISVHRNAIR